MGWEDRPAPGEWLVNSGVQDEAGDAVMKSVRVIRDHDVP
jgi:hypothetical protein